MIVVIAGGHGQIAQHLERLLADAGHEPVGLVRNPDHLADLARQGARGEVVDLERATMHQLPRPSLGPTRWSSPPEPGPAAAPTGRRPSTVRQRSCWPTLLRRRA